MDDIARIESNIQTLTNLKDYDIRKLVGDAEQLGKYLNKQQLKTNQIRKFLDAVNRLKAQPVITTTSEITGHDNTDETSWNDLEVEIVLLKPKLAYAASRQKSAKSLNKVMSLAIDRVRDQQDFNRLVQMVESIIAYHRAAGGQ